MSKILVGIPVVTGYKHTMDCINSVLNQSNIELLIIDNNVTPDLKQLFLEFDLLKNVTIKVNEKNIYVNPSWNQIMFHFLQSDCDLLVIMNSDLTMQKDWAGMLRELYKTFHKASFLPILLDDCVALENIVNIAARKIEVITEGAAGVFITLNKEQCKIVYDIPEAIKVWFGDNWIYGMLRGCGHQTIVADNLIAFHGLSQTIDRIPEVAELIEEDKRMWYRHVQPHMNELIFNHNNNIKIT